MFAKLIIQKFWDPVLISLIKIFNIFLFTGYKTTASHYIHRWNRYEVFFFYLKTFINFKYVLVNEIYFSQLLDIVFINLWSVWQLVGKRLLLLLYCDLWPVFHYKSYRIFFLAMVKVLKDSKMLCVISRFWIMALLLRLSSCFLTYPLTANNRFTISFTGNICRFLFTVQKFPGPRSYSND